MDIDAVTGRKPHMPEGAPRGLGDLAAVSGRIADNGDATAAPPHRAPPA